MPPLPSSRRVSISTGTILRTIAVLVAIAVLWLIRDIILYVFIAMLLAGVMYPLARWAQRHRIPRGVAVFIAYLFLFGIIAAIASLLVPAVIDQAKTLVETHGSSSWQWLSQNLGSLRDVLSKYGLSANIQTSVNTLQGKLQDILGNAVGILTTVFGSIAGLLIVLVLSFYMIVEESAARDLFRNIVPPEYQEFASQVVWQVINKLGAWFRGQLLLGVIIGVLYFIGFEIIGVPYALLLAIFGGAIEFIPYIGPFTAAVPAVLLALTISPWRALATLLVMVVIQQIEANVIVPKVMQRAIGLNPIISILAFLVGAELFGVVGAIFAIPIATALSVALTEVLRFRRERAR